MLTENLFSVLEDDAKGFSGLDFTQEEIERCKTDQDYALVLGLPSNVNCNLWCKFCFTDTHNNCGPQLTLERRLKLLDEAKEIGVKTIITGGSGEPFSDPDFRQILEAAVAKGFNYIIFTNLTTITKRRAEWLRGLKNVSIFGSAHSLNKKTFENITQIPDSFELMMQGAENLIEAGFTSKDFAITSVVCKSTIDELEDIVDYWGSRNLLVFPEYCNITGYGERFREELYVPYEDFLSKKDLLTKKFAGYQAEAPLVTSTSKCFTGEYAVIITINGEVKTCFDGGEKGLLGNINDMSLQDAISKKYANSCFCDGYDHCLNRNNFLKEDPSLVKAVMVE